MQTHMVSSSGILVIFNGRSYCYLPFASRAIYSTEDIGTGVFGSCPYMGLPHALAGGMAYYTVPGMSSLGGVLAGVQMPIIVCFRCK